MNLGAFFSLQILDAVACALLAAAATLRSRALGAHIMGAVVLGCICGLAAPLAREALLNGAPGSRMVLRALPEVALCGALGAIFAAMAAEKIGYKLFLWVDGAGIGLAGCVSAALGLVDLGMAGALVLGLICALGPGLIRDVALGDTARLVDEAWYAAAPAIGIMLTILMLFALAACDILLPAAASVGAGWGLALVIRVVKGSPVLE